MRGVPPFLEEVEERDVEREGVRDKDTEAEEEACGTEVSAVFTLVFCLERSRGLVKLPFFGCLGITTGEGLPTTPWDMVTLVVPPEVTCGRT